jgi:hypothetical protein
MDCPEKIRLQQLYEAALRRCAQVQASSQLFGQATSLTEEVRQRALIDRNAAKNRLAVHTLNCNACRRKTVKPGS